MLNVRIAIVKSVMFELDKTFIGSWKEEETITVNSKGRGCVNLIICCVIVISLLLLIS